ncbi:MAG TPA: DUF5668 domain-containing protein [Cytophagales bacterium]|nr:DUF5668 domain-containing protein [Cytophagales bacterium]
MTSDRILKGLFLVIIGIVLLLNQLDLVPRFFPHFVFSWPMILIGVGIILLLTKPNKTGGLIVLTVGILFLISVNYPPFNPFEYWPIFIILVGIAIMFGKKKGRREDNREEEPINQKEMDEVAIFSGGERIITSNEFSGGNVTTVFGGTEVNLLHSRLAPGKNVIEVFSMFGGATFYVPSDWKVRVEVIAIFGGFADKRMTAPEGYPNADRELVIKGFVIFGGGEIKSFR